MSYINNVLSREPDHLTGYWHGTEASDTIATDLSGNNRNGAYSNVLLGQPGIGDTLTAPAYNGTNSYTNLYSLSLATAFNGQEGTTGAWVQMPTATWNTATARRIVTFQSNPTNRVILQKTSTNTLNWFYQAGGVTKTVTKTGMTSSDWFHVAMTWSKSADELKLYFNGVQFGDTITGLGTYAAVPLDVNRAIIGASQPLTPIAVWLGKIAHVPVWDVALSADDVRLLAMVFGPVEPDPRRTVIVHKKDRTIIVHKKDRTIYV